MGYKNMSIVVLATLGVFAASVMHFAFEASCSSPSSMAVSPQEPARVLTSEELYCHAMREQFTKTTKSYDVTIRYMSEVGQKMIEACSAVEEK